MKTRREFLTLTLAGCATLALSSQKLMAASSQPVGLQLYTLREQAEADLPKTLPDPKAATSRHAGGRPERPDWLEFDQEAIAKAVLDGGDLTRSELNRFMDTWAKDHLRKPLDERQTRQRINKLFRKGLLADD